MLKCFAKSYQLFQADLWQAEKKDGACFIYGVPFLFVHRFIVLIDRTILKLLLWKDAFPVANFYLRCNLQQWSGIEPIQDSTKGVKGLTNKKTPLSLTFG